MSKTQVRSQAHNTINEEDYSFDESGEEKRRRSCVAASPDGVGSEGTPQQCSDEMVCGVTAARRSCFGLYVHHMVPKLNPCRLWQAASPDRPSLTSDQCMLIKVMLPISF